MPAQNTTVEVWYISDKCLWAYPKALCSALPENTARCNIVHYTENTSTKLVSGHNLVTACVTFVCREISSDNCFSPDDNVKPSATHMCFT